MRYSGIIENDTTAAPGVCLSFFVQGCPHRCKGCHNPETWEYDRGKEFNNDVLREVIFKLRANNINRTLCIMGGEPMCERNLFLTCLLIREVRLRYPNQIIYVWTGYTLEELKAMKDNKVDYILSNIDCLVDGPYIEELRDVSCPMRGSTNQRIISLNKI